MKRRRSEERDAGSQHGPLQNGYGRPTSARLGRRVMTDAQVPPPAHWRPFLRPNPLPVRRPTHGSTRIWPAFSGLTSCR